MKINKLKMFMGSNIKEWESTLKAIEEGDNYLISNILINENMNPRLRHLLKAMLNHSTKELSLKQRIVFKKIFTENNSQKKVAHELGISESAITQIKNRIFNRVGKYVICSLYDSGIFIINQNKTEDKNEI